MDSEAAMSEVANTIGHQIVTDGGNNSEIQLMPSSNEKPVKRYSATNKGKKSPLSSQGGSKAH